MDTSLIEKYINNANISKELVLDRLLKDKIITDEQALEYAEKWQIIVIKRAWFKRWMDLFAIGQDPKSYQFKYVRFED